MRSRLLVALSLLAGCRPTPAPARDPVPLSVEEQRTDSALRLVLRAAPGARINAQLKPALELADGRVLRFDADSLSPDSAYYAEAPVLSLARGTALHGTLLASVCAEGEQVCQLVRLEVRTTPDL
ncbi:MAG TPA: hypothetical protein VG692_09545 [Gemmatimonadales bacterium]|nr:hypothetical protein [Gemmatimonadales bacterium]